MIATLAMTVWTNAAYVTSVLQQTPKTQSARHAPAKRGLKPQASARQAISVDVAKLVKRGVRTRIAS